jgi:hypothetical protein
LALNAEWDLELLRSEVAAIEDELGKLDLFSDQEREQLLAELDRETGATDEDDAPEVPETPVTALGDLWIVVLDPFGGAGSTLIACEKTVRQARLIEIEPQYVDVTVQRWQRFTGRQATLSGDGRTFARIAQERISPNAEPLIRDRVSDARRAA